MHTFFINTSKQELNIFDEVFDIPREVRDLITLDCPLDQWMDPESGFKGCIRSMGEIIDSYQDVTNNFNLILYVDMIAFRQYASLSLDEHRARSACTQVMHMLLRHYIRDTLVSELEAVGRKANSVLVIFEENKEPNDTADKGLLRKYVWDMMGMPEESSLVSLAEGIKRAENKAELTEEAVMQTIADGFTANVREMLVKDLMSTYEDEINVLYEELCHNSIHVIDSIEIEKYVDAFYDKVVKHEELDKREVHITSFITNRYAEAQTGEMRAKRVVELDLFLLQCIREKSVTVKADAFDEQVGRRFRPINWAAVTELLQKKLRIFNKAYRVTEDMSQKYSDVGLAPTLYSLDSERFGLDEFGNPLTKAVLVNVEEEKKDDEKKKKKKKDKRVRKESRIQRVDSSVFLNGYTLFDPAKSEKTSGESVLSFIPRKTTKPEEYKQKAQELRLVHLKYLDALKAHVSQVLSNYAGRSADNDPALLKKRDISIPEVDYDPVPAVINYSETRVPEERSSKVAHDAAVNGYSNAQRDYFEFYASRAVSLTDVEEPCNWLINKVDEITESLRRIKIIFFVLLGAVLVLYTPYFVLQWDALFDDLTSVLTTVFSVLIPLGLLTLVYFILRELQKRKYLKVWKEFKDRSQQILAENDDATQKYDKMLSSCIPQLRWMYEYVTDVEFYRDCCEIARAKLEHHAFKQKAYAGAIGNILEDLQCSSDLRGSTVEVDPKEIDFGSAFCSGDRNRAFYSIITGEELNTLYEN
ncbi:MAG: hypothetical protein IJ017_04130 [Oscillospiraceae bacterium]|nr:hypothetical protein [Oscillospiraceae bacterium]